MDVNARLEISGERNQVLFRETLSDRRRFRGRAKCCVVIAGADLLADSGDEQVSAYGGFFAALLDEPAGAREPSICPPGLSHAGESKADPECPEACRRVIAGLGVRVAHSFAQVQQLFIVPGKTRGLREELEVRQLERRCPIGTAESLVCIGPLQTHIMLTTCNQIG